MHAAFSCCPRSRALSAFILCALPVGRPHIPRIFRAIAVRAVRNKAIQLVDGICGSNRSVRRCQQQKKDRSVSLVCGGRSSAFRAAHQDRPVGRRDLPPPRPATPAHGRVKDRKLIRPCHHPAPLMPQVICRLTLPEVQNLKEAKNTFPDLTPPKTLFEA